MCLTVASVSLPLSLCLSCLGTSGFRANRHLGIGVPSLPISSAPFSVSSPTTGVMLMLVCFIYSLRSHIPCSVFFAFILLPSFVLFQLGHFVVTCFQPDWTSLLCPVCCSACLSNSSFLFSGRGDPNKCCLPPEVVMHPPLVVPPFLCWAL